jgi:hypothetical protein
MSIDIEFLRYPIGRFNPPQTISPSDIKDAISTIKAFPANFFSAVSPLSVSQLDTPYRPGGWTIRQLVHHCADSHMNAFIRYKLALTEENPTVKPYEEAIWADLPDAAIAIESSLAILKAIHLKWGVILDSMKEEDFKRTYFHPEKNRNQRLEEVTLMYAWHSQHHLAHVQHLVLRDFDV